MTVSRQQVEHVMVVPTLLFREIGYFQGFNANPEPYLKTLLDPSYTSYRPRDEVEQDTSFKQLIPYCIFRCGDEVFHYKRGNTQGEGRLHSKRSIGIGGHISSDDQNQSESAYREGMWREIGEEVVGVRLHGLAEVADRPRVVSGAHLGDEPQDHVRARRPAAGVGEGAFRLGAGFVIAERGDQALGHPRARLGVRGVL